MLRVLNKGNDRAQLERSRKNLPAGADARQNADSAVPKRHADSQHADEFHRGIKKRKRQNGVFEGQHVRAIDFGKLCARFFLAIEELDHAHSGDVFLEERIDARNGGANAPVGIAHAAAKHQRDHQNKREHAERGQSQAPVERKHHYHDRGEHEDIAQHGHHAGGEKFIERVDVGGDARYQATDGVVVKKTEGKLLDVAKYRHAQVVHSHLPDFLHHARLYVFERETHHQRREKNDGNPFNATHGRREIEFSVDRREKIRVHRDLQQERPSDSEDSGHQCERDGDVHAIAVRAKIGQQAAGELSVVGFAEGFFVVVAAHTRSNSSSRSCFWYRSA